ncbi:Uncharacterized protein SCG7086_AC_00080 [Chlamydiales bacterium SCGC AG-110-P3]|nr:Uncharacterized protein SCG7086_AC_00080 [Chlamydiales bacterium SCGC AG-110-P3]
MFGTIGKIAHASRYIIDCLFRASYYSSKTLLRNTWKTICPKKNQTVDERIAAHTTQVHHLLATFNQFKAAQKRVTLERRRNSHLWRPKTGLSNRLNLHDLNQVLRIDIENRSAHVQGTTTMFDLVEETLKFGLIPKVVPELRGITVGGAISGLAVESSSFKYGLFHCSVTEMEVLTGEGKIRVCTKENKNKELFFGLPNSFGSLGYVLSAKVDLVAAKPYVQLEHRKFSDAQSYFNALRKLCLKKEHDFIDGAIFPNDNMVITLAKFVDTAPYESNYRPEKIYYKSIQERDKDYLTTSDYIWRWDTDSFWSTEIDGKPTVLQNPLFRRTLGKALLRSDRMKRLGDIITDLQANIIEPFQDPKNIDRREKLIQDIGFSIEKCEAFYEWYKRKIGVLPIFICPINNPQPDECYPLWDLKYDDIACDFGFFGSKSTSFDPTDGHYNRMIEEKTDKIGGKKSLYSQSFFDRETFERLYHGGNRYSRLKATYDPQGIFPTHYEKCVQNH